MKRQPKITSVQEDALYKKIAEMGTKQVPQDTQAIEPYVGEFYMARRAKEKCNRALQLVLVKDTWDAYMKERSVFDFHAAAIQEDYERKMETLRTEMEPSLMATSKAANDAATLLRQDHGEKHETPDGLLFIAGLGETRGPKLLWIPASKPMESNVSVQAEIDDVHRGRRTLDQEAETNPFANWAKPPGD